MFFKMLRFEIRFQNYQIFLNKESNLQSLALNTNNFYMSYIKFKEAYIC